MDVLNLMIAFGAKVVQVDENGNANITPGDDCICISRSTILDEAVDELEDRARREVERRGRNLINRALRRFFN